MKRVHTFREITDPQFQTHAQYQPCTDECANMYPDEAVGVTGGRVAALLVLSSSTNTANAAGTEDAVLLDEAELDDDGGGGGAPARADVAARAEVKDDNVCRTA